jgi:membrane dipeptidase
VSPRVHPAEATALHRDAVVVDAHNDLLLLVARRRAVGQAGYFRERWLPELRAGGVDVLVLPVYVEPEYQPEGALRQTLRLIELAHREAEAAPAEVALCTSGEAVDRAVAAGRLALLLALEGLPALGTDVELLATFYRLGVRMASFTHFGRTALADGGAEPTGGRLTRAGLAAVREMERLGMLVDVSHLNDAGVDQVLEMATRPVIASHSNARALCDHHRNLTDEQLRGIAATGGVIGVNAVRRFVHPQDPTVERVVDHIEHIAAVAGIAHVGLGLDFVREYYAEVYAAYPDLRVEGLDPRATIPGLATPGDLPALTAAMLRRGIPTEDVRRVLGENFLRVFRQVLK